MFIEKISAIIEKISELLTTTVASRSNQDIGTTLLDESKPKGADGG